MLQLKSTKQQIGRPVQMKFGPLSERVIAREQGQLVLDIHQFGFPIHTHIVQNTHDV